eukprot:COSAG01_NODE_30704_length_610_cov_135.818004_2_plen_52_part_01
MRWLDRALWGGGFQWSEGCPRCRKVRGVRRGVAGAGKRYMRGARKSAPGTGR